MAKYTLKDFEREYPNDAVCLDKLFQMKYGNLECCPNCNKKAEFRRITTRRAYQCRLCYHQIYPTKGTPFEKTRTPLNYWFFAMWLMTTTRNGVAAKELERCLGVTYKTAFKMAQQIRKLMAQNNNNDNKLKGVVEMDETYVRTGTKVPNSVGRNDNDKSAVFGMVERLGQVRAKQLKRVTKDKVYPIVEQNVSKEAIINTDEFALYTSLNTIGYEDHRVIKHLLKNYVEGDISTNTIEGFFSQLKRMIKGTHLHVSEQHLQKYVDEACFRYNNRFKDIDMFGTLVFKIKTFENEL